MWWNDAQQVAISRSTTRLPQILDIVYCDSTTYTLQVTLHFALQVQVWRPIFNARPPQCCIVPQLLNFNLADRVLDA